MKNLSLRRPLALALAVIMVAVLLPVLPIQARAEANTYVLDATKDVPSMAAGTKQDGDFDTFGTDNYFTLIYSVKTKIDGSNKTFDDGYTATQRINFQSKTDVAKGMVPAISFTTSAAATIKLWWVSGGDGRQFALYDNAGEILSKTEVESVKNSLYISELAVDTAGTYFLGVPDGSNYLFKMEVAEQAAEPTIITNTLDATNDVPSMAAGTKQDGDFDTFGTNDYFTLIYSVKTKIDGSNKTFEDGYTATQRINFQSKTDVAKGMVPAISFTTSGPAAIKLWWVSGGDGRQFALYNNAGEILSKTEVESIKNSLYISELAVDAAGTYFLGVPDGSNYLFKMEVTETSSGAEAPRKDWSEVAAPVILNAIDDGEGNMQVNVSAEIGADGGDELFVTMYDAQGNELATRRSIAEKGEHSLLFTPEDSGDYTFKAILMREGQPPKEAEDAYTGAFKLVLVSPILVSATSKGGGSVELVWTAVKEAVSYDIYAGGQLLGSSESNLHILQGLTVGQEYSFYVVAVRGTDTAASGEISVLVTEDAKQTWGFTYYGPSTNADKNGYVGSLNEDGYVTVYSEGGKGKIQPSSTDGLAFYYTAVPTTHNFTLRAKVTVDSWTLSNGQEGFGLLATDRLGTAGDGSAIWNNQYMVGGAKIEYRYDADNLIAYALSETSEFTKYSMKMGIGSIAKTGVTLENLPRLEAGDNQTIVNEFLATTHTLETAAGEWLQDAGTYNIVGNALDDKGNPTTVSGSIERELKTTFILEIQKNNTGYFITYYNEDGTIHMQKKYYDPDALSQLDSEYVYAGFFASRNVRATFSDVTFTTILASEDAPAEEKPVTLIKPEVKISSSSVSTSQTYPLMVDTNVSGYLQITVEGKVVVENDYVQGLVRYYKDLSLPIYGENRIQIQFTPDPEQDLGPDTQLSSNAKVFTELYVSCNKGSYHRKTIYVSPTGKPNGNGTKEYPYDIYTAVDNAVAGQTIILMEGTYKMTGKLTIQRGIDGTETAPISMVADPEAAARPVLDFQGLHGGILHGGDWWYFYGFDVTRSLDGQKGFQVSGNHNVLDQIHTYYNGNTGIQISRYAGADLFPDWPAYNLILNCTSYCNYDSGFEDADGFAAKLTCGEGNVFDGCVAYNNADDGWDLYAKLETGPIGAVTIRNCVAYSNGFVPDVVGEGNGNGFKMGGDSLSGKHVLENCYAFWNLSKGIDSNSCPDIIVKDCVSYNNGSYNVAFYTNNGGGTDFSATGILSFKDSSIPNGDMTRGEQLKGAGSQDVPKYINDTNYYWYGSESYNTSGVKIGAEVFTSLEFKGIIRNADGSINMQGFLERNDKTPANTGVQPGGTASRFDGTLPEDLEHNYSEAWNNTDPEVHWHDCECGDRGQMEPHDFIWVVDKEATPTETGSRHKECTVCAHKLPAVTIYYEEPAPTDPTQPATQPTTQPDPTAPSTGSDQTSEPGGISPVVIVVVVVAVAAAAFVVFKFVIKKKEN